MRCAECGQANVAGSLFCERCGADLGGSKAPAPTPAPAAPTAPAPATSAPPAATTAPAEPRQVCAQCGAENPLEHRVCESCGKPLRPAADDAMPLPAEPDRRVELPGEVPPPPVAPTPMERPSAAALGPRKGKVKLVVEQGMVVGKQFLLNVDTMLVGREDASEEVYPDIDLSGLDEGYVHRKHAMLTFEGSFLFVTHLGGHNRTYVNNRPIADNLAYPLNIGDTVRFGKVLMRLVEAT